jgi:protein-tyrosine phosphatase
MVDIHSHILWQLDDGSQSMEESIAMLAVARENGTTDIVASPHSNSEFTYRPELVDERIRELGEATGGQPRILRGCDFHLSYDNVDHLLDNPGTYTINGTQYLLIECPDFHVGKHTEIVIERLLDAGLIPIVTHPERNPVLQRKLERVGEWVELGCLVQVTALSVTGGFGNSAGEACKKLLDRGLTHIVASDAHDPKHRSPNLDGARKKILAQYGEDAAEILFTENPGNIIQGLAVAGGKQLYLEPPKRWWQFWRARDADESR